MEQHEEINQSALTSIWQNLNSLSGSSTQYPQLDDLRKLPELGLNLTITPSLLDEASRVLCDAGKQYENKLKAESFPISLLRIGSWQRVSRNGGDLVAKCYFAKRKLVWEFLENGLKSKIEFLWANILSLKVVNQENQPGVLEIELNQPPSFHHEIDPEPRKHTQWKLVSDFTGGQASTFRRHHLDFPHGALDKPLEKLFRCDSRLFQLSQQGYPTLESPYFQNTTVGIDLPLNFGVQVSNSNVNPGHLSQHFQTHQQTMYEHFSQHFQTHQQTMQSSLNHAPMADEHMSNQMPIWNQGMNNFRDNLITNPVGGIYTPQVHPTLESLQETEMHQPRFQMVNEPQNMQLINPQTEFYNSVAESNLYQEGNPTSNTSDVTVNYGENMVDDLVVMSNNLASNAGSLIYPQAASWPQFQVPENNMSVNLLPGNDIVQSHPTESLLYAPYAVNDFTWRSGEYIGEFC